MWALGHHEEFFSDQWADDMVKAVAEILRGRYVIEAFTWRGREVKTRITTDTTSATIIDSGWWLVPLPRRALTVHRRDMDYGCSRPLAGPTNEG